MRVLAVHREPLGPLPVRQVPHGQQLVVPSLLPADAQASAAIPTLWAGPVDQVSLRRWAETGGPPGHTPESLLAEVFA